MEIAPKFEINGKIYTLEELRKLITLAEQSQEIRNWPEKKDPSSPACTDPIFECIGWNKALSLCASVVRGNMMTVEEILYQMIKVADLMPYEPYPQTKEAIVHNQAYIKAKEISEAIHAAQQKKMFGEGKG